MRRRAGGIALLAVALLLVAAAPAAMGPEAKKGAANMNVPVIDLHCDTLSRLDPNNLAAFAAPGLEASLPALRQGGVAGQFFAVWTDAKHCPEAPYDYANHMIDFFDGLVKRYPDQIALAGSAREFRANQAAGKVSAFLALEGGEPIRTLADLDHFHARGVRYITLTWNYQTKMADAAKPGGNPKPYGGLSAFGRQAVRRMNELGMIIDVSHASEATVRDVLAESRDPVLATHSDAYALRAHERNLKDDQIQAICAKGGVIGVNFHAKFLTASGLASLADVADHIDHLVKVGGAQCVALGSDFDGSIIVPRGLESAAKFPDLASVLKKRGYPDDQIHAIFAGNALRLIEQVVDQKR
jgi:membrane dipeptidase